MKLIFMTERNQLYVDYKRQYSGLRFYADTLVKLSRSLGCNELIIAHDVTCDKIFTIENDPDKEQECYDLYSNDPCRFENCYYLDRVCKENHIDCEFMSIDKYFSERISSDDLITLGILNGGNDFMNYIMEEYEKILASTSGYFYLSSDGELSNRQHIFEGRIGFLDKIKSLDDDSVFKKKLLGVLVTETSDYDFMNNCERSGISKSKVFYLPMVVDTKNRMNPPTDIDFSSKNNRIMILRNFDKWAPYREELFGTVRGKFDIYESPMPATRKRITAELIKFDGNYKNARFWTTSKMKELLSQYSYYLGESIPRADRFTYKIIEATDAGTLCFLPKVIIDPMGEKYSIAKSLLDEFSDIMLLDPTSDELFKKSLKSIDLCLEESDYITRYNRQKEFVYKYFDSDSDNVNQCISNIIKSMEDTHE